MPFQVTGPLLFHPREEDWVLARGVVDGKVRKAVKPGKVMHQNTACTYSDISRFRTLPDED